MTTSGARPSLADLDALAARFEAAAIPSTEWKHETHLVMGAWHVARYGAEAALERLRAGIRRLNAAHGTVDSDTRGYHETITRAYVRVIAAFLRVRAPEEALDASVAAFSRVRWPRAICSRATIHASCSSPSPPAAAGWNRISRRCPDPRSEADYGVHWHLPVGLQLTVP